jgi:hypothetical protein
MFALKMYHDLAVSRVWIDGPPLTGRSGDPAHGRRFGLVSGSSASATASLRRRGKIFIARMNAESSRHMAFVAISGHWARSTPYAVHNANPTTVTEYMAVDMSWVRRDLMIFHACGAKLTVDAMVAQAPMMVTGSNPSKAGRRDQRKGKQMRISTESDLRAAIAARVIAFPWTNRLDKLGCRGLKERRR